MADKMTLEKFEEACEIVGKVTNKTGLMYSQCFSEQTGNKVYLKPENMQKTGAFKIRGAYYKISTLSEEDRQKGLITASAGNHAQGVAYAARRLKKPFLSSAITFSSYLSRSFSIRLTDTRVDTPFSCMVIPYSRSAAFIVPRLWVITINCVSLVSLCKYFAKRSTLESSSAASISSRRQKGDGFKF